MPHKSSLCHILFETLGRKRKAYSCWSFFICENALPCNDMIALSLRSLKTIKSNTLEWIMVITCLRERLGTHGSFTKPLHVLKCTNRVTPKGHEIWMKEYLFVSEVGSVIVKEICSMSLCTGYLTHKGLSCSAVFFFIVTWFVQLCYFMVSHYSS